MKKSILFIAGLLILFISQNSYGHNYNYLESTTSKVILTEFETQAPADFVWDGSLSADWGTAANWDQNAVPDASSDVTIPDVTTYPLVSSAQSCNNLLIESGGELTVSSTLTINGTFTIESNASKSGSLIITTGGSISTNITYERYITGTGTGDNKWHMISSPVDGQNISALLTNVSNSIATKQPASVKYFAMADYIEASDDWSDFYQSSVAGTFSTAKGYEVMRTVDGTISFTGSVRTGDVTGIVISQTNNGWNLIGNPYTSAINANRSANDPNNFIKANETKLDADFVAIYFWDADGSEYKAINNTDDAYHIPPGQGFFVRAKDNSSTVSITKVMQSHQTGADFKSTNSPWPNIKLIAESNDASSNTRITFIPGTTKGLDIGYDAGVFEGNQDFSLYSRLVEDNGTNFCIQSLPEEYDNLIIPIGLNVPEGVTVTFKAEATNLKDDCSCYLENRDAGTYTSLEEPGSTYTFTTSRRNSGLGAFFLHTSIKTLGVEDNKLTVDPYKIIVNKAGGYIRVVGKMDNNSQARVYDLAGRLRVDILLDDEKDNIIPMSDLNSGIYILQILNNNELIRQKISW